MIALPTIRAAAILADPPIGFATWSVRGQGRSPQRHYSCLTFEQLASIPVASTAGRNCFLFCWIPLRSIFLVEPFAWGFRFSGAAFAWVKQNRSDVGWFLGGGYTSRHNLEVCLLRRRGSPRRKAAGVRELIVAPRREHSRKPDETYRCIEALCDEPHLELFARSSGRAGTSVGDELGRFQAVS
jgi:N6-adenosine-specific RNA methylase IME4